MLARSLANVIQEFPMAKKRVPNRPAGGGEPFISPHEVALRSDTSPDYPRIESSNRPPPQSGQPSLP